MTGMMLTGMGSIPVGGKEDLNVMAWSWMSILLPES